MNRPRMPILTAANREPNLRQAVRRLKAIGLDASRVQLVLQRPRINCWQEVIGQDPPSGRLLTASDIVTVSIDPDCGAWVPLKQAWYARLEAGQMEAGTLSRYLWQLGELQNRLAHPPDLLAGLLQREPDFLNTFGGLTPDHLAIFEPRQTAALLNMLPWKRNSHQPRILSRFFSRILGFNCMFQSTCNPSLPHILLATLEIPPEQLTPAWQARISLLEYLLVPATCKVVYLYRHSLAVLDHTGTRLNATQAG